MEVWTLGPTRQIAGDGRANARLCATGAVRSPLRWTLRSTSESLLANPAQQLPFPSLVPPTYPNRFQPVTFGRPAVIGWRPTPAPSRVALREARVHPPQGVRPGLPVRWRPAPEYVRGSSPAGVCARPGMRRARAYCGVHSWENSPPPP